VVRIYVLRSADGSTLNLTTTAIAGGNHRNLQDRELT
jgi:hypothetical protein